MLIAMAEKSTRNCNRWSKLRTYIWIFFAICCWTLNLSHHPLAAAALRVQLCWIWKSHTCFFFLSGFLRLTLNFVRADGPNKITGICLSLCGLVSLYHLHKHQCRTRTTHQQDKQLGGEFSTAMTTTVDIPKGPVETNCWSDIGLLGAVLRLASAL